MNHRTSLPSSSPAPCSWLAPLLRFVAVSGLIATLCACGRPKEEDCTKAVANIRNLYGTAGTSYGVTPQAAVRSCRGSASDESVKCMIEAKSIEDLEECKGDEFLKAIRGDVEDKGDEAPIDQGEGQGEKPAGGETGG